MKKVTLFPVLLLLIVLKGWGASTVTLDFRVTNPRILYDWNNTMNGLAGGDCDNLVFDLEVKGDAVSYCHALEIHMTTNTAALTDLDFTLASGWTTYYSFITFNLTNNNINLSVANSQTAGSAATARWTQIPTTWKSIGTLKLRVADISQLQNCSWIISQMTGQQKEKYFTPSPGIQTYLGFTCEGTPISNLYLGRIYSSNIGWSQVGGSTEGLQYIDWTTAVNTSVWSDTTGTFGVAQISGAISHLASALRIHPSARLKIMPGGWFTCSGATEINEPQGLRVLSDATGTGSFIDNGSITYNTGGTAKVERYFPNDSKWHYYGLPVTTAVAAPFTGLFMRWFNETTYAFRQIIQVDTVLYPLWGYSVQANGSNATVAVSGSLNTGNLSTQTLTSTFITTDYDGNNFIGNPYPSGTDWELWSRSGIDPTMYCWNGNGYETWDASTHLGTKTDKYIRPEQGFFCHVTTNGGTGHLSVSNAARTHVVGSYNKSSGINDELKLTATANGIDDQALIIFNSDATVNFDPDYDAYKLTGTLQSPNLYSRLPDGIIAAVNWLPWTGTNQVVPMGFSCGLSGVCRITASNMESFNPTTQIYIEDLKENFTQDLVANPAYDFNYITGENPNRFLIHFSNSTTGISDHQSDELQIYSWQDIVYVKHLKPGNLHGTVSIYDLSGREVFNGVLENILLNKYIPDVTSGFYVVKVQTDKVFVTGKVFLNKQ